MSLGESVTLRFCFFFNDPATTEIYTLPLHDALPISQSLMLLNITVAPVAPAILTPAGSLIGKVATWPGRTGPTPASKDLPLSCTSTPATLTTKALGLRAFNTGWLLADRKSTRLNSSH